MCDVKIYNASSSLERFESKKYFQLLWKITLAYFNTGAVIVNSEVIGSAPGANPTIASYNASVVNFYNG
jgi:hypothetical protein